MQWAYNWMLQACLADAVLEPEPPVPSGTSSSTPTPIACVGVTPVQLQSALATQTETIQAMLAALKTDILNVVATNVSLQSSTNQILAAIADISCGPTETPPDQLTDYAQIGTVKYAALSAAARDAVAGSIVEIHGVLTGRNATAAFPNSCTIRGMTSNAKLLWNLGTSAPMAMGKGLIVCSGTTGQSYLIENLELTGARVPDANGAGVRGDPCGQITIQNCNIHDNENGVLSIANVQFYYNNTFLNNGNSVGNAHGVYVNSPNVSEVTAEGNSFGKAIQGNQFKSRAKKTTFRHNTVAELDGQCSWQVDISNGGDVLIEKNVIEQGPNAANRNMVSYAPEGLPADGRVNNFVFQNNIVIQDHPMGSWGIYLGQPAPYQISNNFFIGIFSAYVTNGSMDETNQIFPDRASAGYAPYPFLPEVPV